MRTDIYEGLVDNGAPAGNAYPDSARGSGRPRRRHHRVAQYSWLAAGALSIGIATALVGSGAAGADISSGATSSDGDHVSNSASSPRARESSGNVGKSSARRAAVAARRPGDRIKDVRTADAGATSHVAAAPEAGVDRDRSAADRASTPAAVTRSRPGRRGARAVEPDTGSLITAVAGSRDRPSGKSKPAAVEVDLEPAGPAAVIPAPTVDVDIAATAPTVAESRPTRSGVESPVSESVSYIAVAAGSATTTNSQPMSLGDMISAFLLGLQRSMFNRTPTAKYSQNTGQTSAGVVTGTVTASDPDGDPLAVELSVGPKKGAVTVDVDGSFVYTPSAALLASGGTDTFTVIVRETNAAEHSHGMATWISRTIKALTLGAVVPNDGSYITKVVTVSIAKAGIEAISQQRGFAMPTWQVDGYDGPDVEQSLKEIKALGATYVEFVPTWYQTTLTSSEISRSSSYTVSDAGLERAITLAHALGLKVFLKPHVDLPDPATQPRSLINPSNPDAWYSSYTAFITHYAGMAQRLGVEEFSVGCELDSLTSDRARWLKVIAAVREKYTGLVTYAAGWDWNTASFLDQLDVLGVDAYPILSQVPTTDVASLEEAWQWVVDAAAALSAQYGKKILFTEAGYTSQLGTTTDPASWQISTTVSEEEQAAAYEALLATFTDQTWWQGVFWWVWGNPPNSTPEPLDFSPEGKLAESVIANWWGTSTAAV